VTSYHVTLGGQGLMLDLSSYRKRTAKQLAGKVAGGDLSTADLLVEQVWRLADWSGGEGQLQVDSAHPTRYRSGLGVDGFSYPGSFRAGPSVASAFASAVDGFTCACVFQGVIYAGTTDGKIYRSPDGVNWTLFQSWGKAGGVRAMCVYKGAVYFGNGSDGDIANYDGTTWNAAKTTIASVTGCSGWGRHEPITGRSTTGTV
jgi:hypothetical protein